MADGKPAPAHALEAEYGGHCGWLDRLTEPERERVSAALGAVSKHLGLEDGQLTMQALNDGWEHFDDRPTKLGGTQVKEVDSELMRQAMQWFNSRF